MAKASKPAKLSEGDAAPDFTLPATGGDVSLSDFAGKSLVLYFYPKDDTPGCTNEAKDFSELLPQFQAAGAEILGVSKDTLAKHEKFSGKHGLTIRLGSDEDGTVCDGYGVWVEKNMYGKTYMGIQRATFLIGPTGEITRIWPKVRVKGHAAEVLEAL